MQSQGLKLPPINHKTELDSSTDNFFVRSVDRPANEHLLNQQLRTYLNSQPHLKTIKPQQCEFQGSQSRRRNQFNWFPLPWFPANRLRFKKNELHFATENWNLFFFFLFSLRTSFFLSKRSKTIWHFWFGSCDKIQSRISLCHVTSLFWRVTSLLWRRRHFCDVDVIVVTSFGSRKAFR